MVACEHAEIKVGRPFRISKDPRPEYGLRVVVSRRCDDQIDPFTGAVDEQDRPVERRDVGLGDAVTVSGGSGGSVFISGCDSNT